MLSDDLKYLHKSKSAQPNRIYKDSDGKAYIGTTNGRLESIPNYKEFVLLNKENKVLDSKIDKVNSDFTTLNKKLTYSQFELDEFDNLMLKEDYEDSEYFFFSRFGEGTQVITMITKDNSILGLEEKYFELDINNDIMPK